MPPAGPLPTMPAMRVSSEITFIDLMSSFGYSLTTLTSGSEYGLVPGRPDGPTAWQCTQFRLLPANRLAGSGALGPIRVEVRVSSAWPYRIASPALPAGMAAGSGSVHGRTGCAASRSRSWMARAVSTASPARGAGMSGAAGGCAPAVPAHRPAASRRIERRVAVMCAPR